MSAAASVMEETIGILGGSFNPVHAGHTMLASYLCQWGFVDKVWLTLSPQNPIKDAAQLIPDMRRLSMLNIATKGQPGVETCDIELSMPRPSYTINTLDTLARRYPTKRFKLIIGSDNWLIFERWRDWQRILNQYGVIVYPRPGYEVTEDRMLPGMILVDAPTVNISSSFIRRAVADGKNMTYFLPAGVFKFIQDNRLYMPGK